MSVPGPDPEPIPAIRALLADDQYDGVRATVLDNNPDMDEATAGRIVDEALKFVAACAQFPDVAIAPSRVVDEGWHALILHTQLYADLCTKLGGNFIHHVPERPDPSRHDADIMRRTVALIGEAGHSVEQDLWRSPDDALVLVAAKCQHSPNCGIKVEKRPKPPPPQPKSV